MQEKKQILIIGDYNDFYRASNNNSIRYGNSSDSSYGQAANRRYAT